MKDKLLKYTTNSCKETQKENTGSKEMKQRNKDVKSLQTEEIKGCLLTKLPQTQETLKRP